MPMTETLVRVRGRRRSPLEAKTLLAFERSMEAANLFAF